MLRGVDPVMQRFVHEATAMVARSGGVLRVTSGRRSMSEQKRLYQRYLSGLSPYPAAPPGHSEHERGAAVDAVVEPRWMLYALGEAWQGVGGVWGGERDPVHFGY